MRLSELNCPCAAFLAAVLTGWLVAGMHTLCLDNRMSTISGKTVNFHLYDRQVADAGEGRTC